MKELSLILNNKPIEITGLITWVEDNKKDTIKLLNQVKRINFQLYRNDENIFPKKSFITFIDHNKNANLAITCNDFQFYEKIIDYIDKAKTLSVGFFINNSCSVNANNKS